MAEFARYYVLFLINLGQNVAKFFVTIFNAIIAIFSEDIPKYFNDFIMAAPSFNVGAWIVFVLTFLVTLAFLFFLTFRIIQLLRRYIFFRAKEVEKDQCCKKYNN